MTAKPDEERQAAPLCAAKLFGHECDRLSPVRIRQNGIRLILMLGIMRESCSKSMRNVILTMITSVLLILLVGCGESSESVVKKKLFSTPPAKDVTTSPYYYFSSFTGTVWKTKTKTAIAVAERAPHPVLWPPERFDSTNPNYTPIRDVTLNSKVIEILPPGAHLRISRLLEDQGVWGGVLVEAILLDGTNAQKAVYLDPLFLVGNAWYRGPISNTNWAGNPDILEKP